MGWKENNCGDKSKSETAMSITLASAQRIAAEIGNSISQFCVPVTVTPAQPRLKYGVNKSHPEYFALARKSRRNRLLSQGLTVHGTPRKPIGRVSKYGLDRKTIGHAAYVAAIRRIQKEQKLRHGPARRQRNDFTRTQ